MRDKRIRLSRRDFLGLSIGAAAGTVLAACAGQTPAPEAPAVEEEAPEAAEAEEEAPAAQPPAEETVLIEYQSREPEMAGGVQKLWNEFYPKFQEENPNIEVEFLPDPGGEDRTEKALAQMVAGNAPDLLEWCCWSSTYFVQKEQTLNLQPLIDRDAEEVNLDDYYSGQFDPWKDEANNIHLMPRFTGTQIIYYNKDMFDEAGVEYPPDTWGEWDYDDFVAIAKNFVKTETPQVWGCSNYGYNANWLSQYWIRGFGGNMVDPEDHDRCALVDPPAIEALEFLRQMIWDENVLAYGSALGGLGVLELFIAQRIPMMEMGPWNLGPVAEGARFKWDVAPMPDGPAGPSTHQSVDGTMIWKDTQNPEESWTLMKALTSPWYGELYAKYATKQPSRISVIPKFVEAVRSQNPVFEEVKLEVFTDSVAQGLGGPEEMFNNDQVGKNQILTPAFDKVMLLGEAPVDYIVKHGEIVTKFNRGEIGLEDIGSAMEAVEL